MVKDGRQARDRRCEKNILVFKIEGAEEPRKFGD